MAKARDIDGLEQATSFRDAAAMAVTTRAEEVFEHAHGVLDTTDIERVHAMRVATRRLRAVLEIFAVCFPRKQHKAVLREVKALADALGARRDPDVQLEALEEAAAALGPAERPGVELFAATLRAEQQAGNETLAAALRQAEERGLRERLERLVA